MLTRFALLPLSKLVSPPRRRAFRKKPVRRSEFNSSRVSLDAGSPLIAIESDSLVDIAYEGSISGIKFSLHIDADTPAGNYNICAIAPSGARACIPGGIVVLP